jgi:hypothetical protein
MGVEAAVLLQVLAVQVGMVFQAEVGDELEMVVNKQEGLVVRA